MTNIFEIRERLSAEAGRPDTAINPDNLIGTMKDKSDNLIDYFKNIPDMLFMSSEGENLGILELGDRLSTTLERHGKEAKDVIRQIASENPALSLAYSEILSNTCEKVEQYGKEWFREMQNFVDAVNQQHVEAAGDAADIESNHITLTDNTGFPIVLTPQDHHELNQAIHLLSLVEPATSSTLDKIRSLFIETLDK